MEKSEFDATLGGTEHLPHSANSYQFAKSRSVEIAAMTESILRPSKTKLIFQTLPVHMRRRVMSHNCKRLPRRLREGHMEQLKKSGLPPNQKRPSRKFRRRPGNLLEEYNRRQKRNVWLETHIWHAKRFHMVEHWGFRLAYASCDKAFRACYRATSAHCLIQDISYYIPMQIRGTKESIKNVFDKITNHSCGLSICAKAFLSGNREGSIHLYKVETFPYGYIGTVQFLWLPDNSANKTLWLFVHPSQAKQVETILCDLCSNKNREFLDQPKKRKRLNDSSQVEINVFPGMFNRFRLTGPLSQAVIVHSLKCIDEFEKIKNNKWVSLIGKNKVQLQLKEKYEYWKNICKANTPSQLPPSMITGLVVRDPRLSRPSYRTKARHNEGLVNVENLLKIPACAPISPLWETEIQDTIKKNMKSNSQFIEHIRKTQIVPGEIYEDDPELQSIPIVLIHRPGSQDSNYKKVGYGSGWDIVVPSGYGLPFWQLFIMFGARSGGLRETEILSFEMGQCYLTPDSNAGKENEKQVELQLRERYFKLPPNKRVNYSKLGVNSPFKCPWEILLKDWNHTAISEFFILRDKSRLKWLQDCLQNKVKIPEIDNTESCLVAVYVHIENKGSLKNHALICLPHLGDLSAAKTLFEPHHEDPNRILRKQKRMERNKEVKRQRRKRKKEKQLNKKIEGVKKIKVEPSEYVKCMRELWVPSKITNVRNISSRQVLGYVSQGAFSFSEARSCGIGYIAYNGLSHLLQSGQNKILIRNTTSRKYRVATFQIINM